MKHRISPDSSSEATDDRSATEISHRNAVSLIDHSLRCSLIVFRNASCVGTTHLVLASCVGTSSWFFCLSQSHQQSQPLGTGGQRQVEQKIDRPTATDEATAAVSQPEMHQRRSVTDETSSSDESLHTSDAIAFSDQSSDDSNQSPSFSDESSHTSDVIAFLRSVIG